MRQLLNADRVAVFQFDPNSNYDLEGFISEDVNENYPVALAQKVEDHCFGDQFAAHYNIGKTQAVADIYSANLSQCHIDILAQFNVRANLIVPLRLKDNLWGLLVEAQNGDIYVTSTLGKGSCFTITLPYSIVDSVPQATEVSVAQPYR